MKRSAAILVFLMCVGIAYASAISPAKIPLTSPLYAQTDLLYRLHGMLSPSSARPWSVSEAAEVLSAIPEQSAFTDLLHATQSLLKEAKPKVRSDAFAYNLMTTINLESYAHTNTKDFVTIEDWVYGYDQRQSMVDFTMQVQYHDRFYFDISVPVGISAASDSDEPITNLDPIGALFGSGEIEYQKIACLYQMGLSTNLITPETNLYADWPRSSQLSLGGDWWSVSGGRGSLRWGNGMSGDLVVGSHINNHNHFSASVFSKDNKLQFLAIFLPNPLKDDTKQSIFLGHRLESNLRPWLRLSFTENAMYKGPSLPLRYYDPTYFYHNLYDGDHMNAIASIEADILIAPALSFHGQFALDQYQLSNESDSVANALAHLLQLTYSWKACGGYWSISGEYVSTDPSFYRRDDVDFLLARGLHNNGEPVLIDYLGYQYGSDSKVYHAQLSYLIPQRGEIKGSLTIHRQGEVDYFAFHHENDDGTGNNTDDPNISGPSPSGNTITERLIIGLGGTYHTSIANLTLYGQLNWIGRRTYDRSTEHAENYADDFQVVFGVTKQF